MNNQTMQEKHTRTPWALDYDKTFDRFTLRGAYYPFGHFHGWSVDGVTKEEEDRANAQFIVRAVNAHEALLNACKAAMEERSHRHGDARAVNEPYYSRNITTQLSAAIALAEGGDK